jgi:predicted phage-related endonuclease
MAKKQQVRTEPQRIDYIGGYDAAPICDVKGARKSSLTVYLEKIGVLEPEDVSNKLAVRIGKALEDLVVEIHEEDNKVRVGNRGAEIFNSKYPFIRGHIDGSYTDTNGKHVLLEAKTTSVFLDKNWDELHDEVPVSVLYQVYHYFLCDRIVTEKAYDDDGRRIPEQDKSEPIFFDYAAASVFIGNSKKKNVKIERVEEKVEELLKKEASFWLDHVVPEVEPPMPENIVDPEVLYQIYPEAVADSFKDMSDSEEVVHLSEKYLEVKALVKEKTEELENLKAKLQYLMGTTEVIAVKGVKYSWKNQDTTRLDIKRLKAEHLDTYTMYASTITSRVFRDGKIKGE